MQNQQVKKKAYSYIRFSTPEQSKGDSFRRQTHDAQKYANENNLQLQNTTFQDLGKSAYDGTNVEIGALSLFLEAVNDGSIANDSYLLVESLDRISRQSARKAANILGDICDLGITVVTLIDKKVYTKAAMDDISFIYAVFIFVRANEESLTKSSRGKANWHNKREKAVKELKPMTNLLPKWLLIKDDKIVVDRYRSRLVKYIFKKFLSGTGYASIASEFNEHSIKTWKNGKFWHRSYIKKILQNPAVVGVYTPHLMVREGIKKKRVPQESINNYFPAVIDEYDFQLVQAALKPGLSKSTNQQNIFATLAKCPLCKSTLTRKSYGENPKSGSPALICTNARAKAGCDFKPLKIDPLEHYFIKYARQIFAQTPSSLIFIQKDHAKLSDEIDVIKNKISNLNQVLAMGPSKSIAKSLFDIESDLAVKLSMLDEIEHTIYESSAEIMHRRRSAVVDYFSKYDGNAATANLYLKSMIKAIYFDREYCEIVWRNGHSTFEYYVAYDNLQKMGVNVDDFYQLDMSKILSKIENDFPIV